jgi:hypothetical protein
MRRFGNLQDIYLGCDMRKRKVVGGDILKMVSEGMSQWLDEKKARIVGLNEGKIILTLEDKDWKSLYKDLFKEEYKDG